MLTSYGIPCTILLDSAVSYAMAKVDAVIVGAEAVAQNGGLVNFVSIPPRRSCVSASLSRGITDD